MTTSSAVRWELRYVRAIVRHRAWVVAITLLITLLAGWFALRLTFDSRIDIWFLDDDPDLVAYQEFLERFQADEIAMIGVFAPDVFAPEVLATVDRVTRAAEGVPHAHRVRSVTNIRIARASDEMASFGPLVAEIPATAEAAAALRVETLAHPIVGDLLVNRDGTATAIIVELSKDGNSFEGKREMTVAIEEILAREARPGIEFKLAGSPPLDRAFLEYSKRDSMVLGPAAVLLVLLTSFFVFRRLSAALVPLSVVVVAITWLYGLMAFLGVKINMVSTSLLALILAVGVADSIHVVSDYYQHLMEGADREQAVERAVANLIAPCFFTSATTAAGFLSLMTSSLKPIREFGWLAAIGVTLAFVVSLTLVPAVLRLAKPPDPRFIERQKTGVLSRALVILGQPTPRRSGGILVVAALLGALSILGLMHIEVGSNPMNYFRKSAHVRQDTEALDRALGGTTSVEFLVETDADGLKDPETLRKLDTFQDWLEEQPGITRTLSVVDSLKELNRVMSDGSAASAVVPSSSALAAQLYLLLEGEDDFDSSVQDDYSVARITARVSLSKANELTARVPVIEAKIREKFDQGKVHVKPTGFVKLMGDMETYLISSQIRSFLIAFAVITAMMMLLLRSPRLGLFSMIPNLLPVLMGIGFMSAVGIELDPGTVMIGGIALGLVVDDTVHFLVRLRRRELQGESVPVAIRHAMTDAGRPIIITSVVLSAGFSILGLGSFAPNVYFGLVSALIIVLALLCDVLVMPAALLLVSRTRFARKPVVPVAAP